MRPQETFLSTGWHMGMTIMCKNGDAEELSAIFTDEIVTSPNPNYQIKLGEGPSSQGVSYAFALTHTAVYSDSLTPVRLCCRLDAFGTAERGSYQSLSAVLIRGRNPIPVSRPHHSLITMTRLLEFAI
jgi:hypothetical protein